MSQSFFPESGEQVVRIWPEEEEGITFVQARNRGETAAEPTKIRIFRLAIGSLLRASLIKVSSANVKPEFHKRAD